jgi:DNA-binding transcriptional regulator YiaG
MIQEQLHFLRLVGADVDPDPANIPHLRRAGWSNQQLAETYGVSVRTIQRYHVSKHRCPGYPEGRCLTDVQGGGLCSFCVRSKAGV